MKPSSSEPLQNPVDSFADHDVLFVIHGLKPNMPNALARHRPTRGWRVGYFEPDEGHTEDMCGWREVLLAEAWDWYARHAPWATGTLGSLADLAGETVQTLNRLDA